MKFKRNGFFREIIDTLPASHNNVMYYWSLPVGFRWDFCAVFIVFRRQTSYGECAFALTGHAFYHTDIISYKNTISERAWVKLKIYLFLM